MQILLLGGTGFIGSHMARALVIAGHRVSVLSRGETWAELPAEVERLPGNRNTPNGLDALKGRYWDACIDLSGYLPQQVRRSGELLAEVRRYVFVSAVAVYGDPEGPVTEDFPTLRLTEAEQAEVQSVDDLNNRTYGPSKIACEDVLRGLFTERLTVLRPQVVTGPHDLTARFTVWPARAANRAAVMVPGDGRDFLQVIDVRDIAAFVVRVLQDDLSGTFNLAGPRVTWAEFAEMLNIQRPVWVPAAEFEARGVTISDFPLFRPTRSVRSGLMNISSAKAQATGLKLTPLMQTLTDTHQAMSGAEIQQLGEPSTSEALLLESLT